MIIENDFLNGFIGAKVKNISYGNGVIKRFQMDDCGNFFVTVTFYNIDETEIEKVFSAKIAFLKNVLVFEDEESNKLISAFFEHKESFLPSDNQLDDGNKSVKIATNNHVNILIERIIESKGVANELIDLFDDEKFEKELYSDAFRFLEAVMDGRSLNPASKACVLLALTLIALKYYNGDLHSFIENKYRETRINTEYNYTETNIRNGMYKVVGDYRTTVKYFDPHSYVAVPIVLSCVPHYRVKDLFRIAYDIYKRKLLFDEDVSDEQIEEKAKEAFLALRRKDLISDSDIIKGTNYLMSKYTQSCIYSGFGLEALSKIITKCIRLIIDHLTRPEDSFSVASFYQEGYSAWVKSFEEDVKERERYEQTRTISHPYFKLVGDSVHIITGKHSMDDSLDPNDVHIIVYSGSSVIKDHLITDPNSILLPDNDSVMNGYIIERQDLVLPCSPIKEISYSVVSSGQVVYDSKSRLFRANLFFDGRGNEIKPGTHYVGELFVITKDSNNDDNGNGLTELYHKRDYVISTIEVNDYDVFHFDGEPYIFFKVSTSQLTSYAVPWGEFVSFEGKRLQVYNNIVILFPASCDKEQIFIEIDGQRYFYSEYDDHSDIRFSVKLFSKEQNEAWAYTVKIYNLPAGFHRIRIFNAVTGKQIKGASFEIVYDYDMRKSFISKDEAGIKYRLTSSFFEEQTLEYAYGTSIIKHHTFINNIGHGDLEIFPSSISYSIDGQHWFDIGKKIYLCEIPDSIKSISVCGPQKMKAFYLDHDSVIKKQELNLSNTENEPNQYTLSLSFLRSLIGKKYAVISFEFNNRRKQIKTWYNPYVLTKPEDFYFDKAKNKHIFTINYESDVRIKVEITPIPSGSALVSKTISSGETIEINEDEIEKGIHYLSVALFGKKGSSLFDQFQSEPFMVFKKYDLGRPSAHLTTIPPQISIVGSVLSGQFDFEGASKIKVELIPTAFCTPLISKYINSGETVSFGLNLLPFNSYMFRLYNIIDETTEQISKEAFFVSRQIRTESPFLKKIMRVSSFVLNDNSTLSVNYTIRFNEIRELQESYYLLSSMINRNNDKRTDDIYIRIIGDSGFRYTAEMLRLSSDRLRSFKLNNGKIISKIIIEKD